MYIQCTRNCYIPHHQEWCYFVLVILTMIFCMFPHLYIWCFSTVFLAIPLRRLQWQIKLLLNFSSDLCRSEADVPWSWNPIWQYGGHSTFKGWYWNLFFFYKVYAKNHTVIFVQLIPPPPSKHPWKPSKQTRPASTLAMSTKRMCAGAIFSILAPLHKIISFNYCLHVAEVCVTWLVFGWMRKIQWGTMHDLSASQHNIDVKRFNLYGCSAKTVYSDLSAHT